MKFYAERRTCVASDSLQSHAIAIFIREEEIECIIWKTIIHIIRSVGW